MSYCSMPISGRSLGGLRGWSRPLAAGRADIVNGYRWPMPAALAVGHGAHRRGRSCHCGVAAAAADQTDLGRFPRRHPPCARHPRSAQYDRANTDRGSADRRPGGRNRAAGVDAPGDPAADTARAAIFADLWRFGRRQYQLIRLYRPRLWCFAAFVVTTDLIARLALLSTLPAWPPGWAAILVVAGLGSITVEIRLAIGRKLGAPDGIGFRLSAASSGLDDPAGPVSSCLGDLGRLCHVTGDLAAHPLYRRQDRSGGRQSSRRPHPTSRFNRGSRRTSADRRPAARSGGRPG